MLQRAGHDHLFPQNDLAYLAFRLTACQVFYRIGLATEASPNDTLPEGTRGFLESSPQGSRFLASCFALHLCHR